MMAEILHHLGCKTLQIMGRTTYHCRISSIKGFLLSTVALVLESINFRCCCCCCCCWWWWWWWWCGDSAGAFAGVGGSGVGCFIAAAIVDGVVPLSFHIDIILMP